ncbi:glycosyltransferase [Amnibacterium endophyticum]|uniref:Glycosyltransferase n=1 Tax=Amnibacterium endophyticum TaxID=2109337 RepID=A0ABW4LDL1_9MICO
MGGHLLGAALELAAAPAYSALTRAYNRQIERTFGVRLRGDLRASPRHGDAWVQLTVPRFEYPRTALPRELRFIGPLRPPASDPVPEWWDPRREPPVVAVRADGATALRDLVLPTIRAFGGAEETVVIAGTARCEVEAVHDGPLPGNVHFEERMPWSRLIARRSVVVSDGDYLHSQHALRFGIPLVTAGTLETDVETAARVAWSGAGVNLRQRRPSPDDLREAVLRIREDDAYRLAAARIAAQIATTDAEGAICALVEEHAAARI